MKIININDDKNSKLNDNIDRGLCLEKYLQQLVEQRIKKDRKWHPDVKAKKKQKTKQQ